jgi:hypothetical protein
MVSETRPPLGNRVGEGSSLLCFGGCHLSDFLNFLGILYPQFWLFGRKLEFFNSHA